MKHYDLKPEEVVLYKGDVSIEGKKGSTQLVLTNTNLVLITKHKPLFAAEEVETEVYTLEQIKTYNGLPHFMIDGLTVELYLIPKEREATFISKSEMNKFVSTIKELFTGKTSVERGAEKVKKSIAIVDDTLGIDSVHVAGNAIKNGTVGKTTSLIEKGIGLVGNIFKKK